jgi:hypothetical protein
MNEEQLRALVRDAVARHLEGAPGRFQAPMPAEQLLTLSPHASHFRYSLPDSGGPCLIEPNVQCNHCGYCQSHGH